MGILEGEQVTLRALEPEDLDLLYQWENNTDIWWLGNTLKPYSKDVLKKFLKNAHLDIYDSKQLRLVICSNQNDLNPIGFIDLFDFDPHHQRAGVGILVAETKNREKGYGREALEILCRYAFNILLLNQLHCSIPENNGRSIHLFEITGFKKTGERPMWIKTTTGWLTDYFFQLSKDDWLVNSA